MLRHLEQGVAQGASGVAEVRTFLQDQVDAGGFGAGPHFGPDLAAENYERSFFGGGFFAHPFEQVDSRALSGKSGIGNDDVWRWEGCAVGVGVRTEDVGAGDARIGDMFERPVESNILEGASDKKSVVGVIFD